MKETQVQSLGWDSPLEEDMATHSSILFFFLIYFIYFIWLHLVLVAACGISFPDHMGPMDGKRRVLAIGPPGKSLQYS